MNLIKSLLASTALLLAVPQLAQAEILVGFVTGLSGPVSSIGIPNAKGIAAGEAYVGEISGEKVRVIQLDDASDATASARNARKVRTGTVVSDKMQKTVVVAIDRRVPHPVYGKMVTRTKRVKAHDEENSAKTGDTVRIMETRPLSKDKRWRVVEIVERAR